MLVRVAGVIFCSAALFAAAFQIALAAGMPWGRLTWAGRFPGRLPGYMLLCSGVIAGS